MPTMIDIDGGPDGMIAVKLASFTLPAVDGVLLPAMNSGRFPDLPEFVDARGTPEATARTLAQSLRPRLLVLCPQLASPAQTRLAFAVAEVLAKRRRANPAPVVTCGTRPRCAWFSEPTTFSNFQLPLVAGCAVDRLDEVLAVGVVEAGDGVAEADGGLVGEAGGEAEHVAFAGGAG